MCEGGDVSVDQPTADLLRNRLRGAQVRGMGDPGRGGAAGHAYRAGAPSPLSIETIIWITRMMLQDQGLDNSDDSNLAVSEDLETNSEEESEVLPSVSALRSFHGDI